MIVKVTGETVKTCLRVRERGCATPPKNCLKWRVRVQRVGCPPPPAQQYNCQDSCSALGPAMLSTLPQVSPTIEYPAFDIDDEGRVCFYWDDKLLESLPGRYRAEILDEQLRHIATFEIDLASTTLMIDQATNVYAIPTCEDC